MWPATEKESAKKLLGKIQNLACMAMTGFFHTTPTAKLEVMLSLPPLAVFLQGEAGAVAVRLKAKGHWAVLHRPWLHKGCCGWWVSGAATP